MYLCCLLLLRDILSYYYGAIWRICAENAVNPKQPANQPVCWSGCVSYRWCVCERQLCIDQCLALRRPAVLRHIYSAPGHSAPSRSDYCPGRTNQPAVDGNTRTDRRRCPNHSGKTADGGRWQPTDAECYGCAVYQTAWRQQVRLWFPSVLWHCWLGDRKGIRPVKITGFCFVGGDDLTGAMHVQLSPSTLAPVESRMETLW